MSRKRQRNRPNPTTATQAPADAGRSGGRGRWGLIAGTLVVVLLVVVAGKLLFTSQRTVSSQPAAGIDHAALSREHAPTLGDPAAKVHIVEFLDPACETCALFYPAVKQLLAEHPGRIRLSVRHVPFHRGADYVVRVLEASRNQGKYWQTLEALLATQAEWAPHHTVQPEQVGPAIAGVGLDQERLRADMEAPDVAQRMALDLADAQALKVTATPEYFVNGRPLPSFGYEQLMNLVAEELRRAYP